MDVAPCYKLLVYNVYTVYTVACMPVNCWGKLKNYWNGLVWVSSDSEQKVVHSCTIFLCCLGDKI